MDSFCRRIVVLFSLVWLSFASSHDFDASHYPDVDVITRDICVIGGGASGTYAAIRLKDMGKSVVVVEQKDRLGGHTETYIDPATQIPIDYGVRVWLDISVTRNFAKRLNVTLAEFSPKISPPTVIDYVDFRTGKFLNYTPPDPTTAFAAYGAQLAKYPYLLNGFHLQYPVPEDLLIPFGNFVNKYSLQDIVETVSLYVQDFNVLRAPTIYALTFFGQDIFQSVLTHFLTAASHDNSELYQSALCVLGSDALLSSQVVATDRRSDPENVKILVTTPNGLKLIQAKKLIIAIPQTLENLKDFDLCDQERTLFGQFEYTAYYTSVIKDTGIPDDVGLLRNQAANTTYNLPVIPGIYVAQYGAPGLKVFYYASQHKLPIEQVKSNIIDDLKRFQTVENLSPGIIPSIEEFSDHTPSLFRVSPEAIAGGFYKELYALQGQSRTFYTGQAFFTDYSSLVWKFTEALLPSIVA